MASFLTTMDASRTCSIQPAQGLRYGNFEGFRNLPPIRGKDEAISIYSRNNDQIFRLVCHWMETWQTWQQKTLLCGIANRCTERQLDILNTSLEPVGHRDYKTVAKKHYPVDSFKTVHEPKTKKKKKKAKPNIKGCIKLSSTSSKTSGVVEVTEPEEKPGIIHDEKSDRKVEINEEKILKTDDKPDEKTEEVILKPDDKPDEKTEKGIFKTDDKPGEKTEEIVLNSLEKESGEDITYRTNYCSGISKGLLLYALSMSESITKSAVEEAARISVFEGQEFASMKENFNSIQSNQQDYLSEDEQRDDKKQEIDTQVEDKESALDAPEVGNGDVSHSESKIQFLDQPDTGCDSGAVDRPEGGASMCPDEENDLKLPHSSRTPSALFLGGSLQFSDSSPHRLAREKSTASTTFRHSTLASSAASTTDFFDRNRVNILGPMKHPVKSFPFQQPTGRRSMPVPLQKWYKHSRWWPHQPPHGSMYHQPRKHELVANFQHQLMAIWNWLGQWEDFERISFIKEVVKQCSPKVLDSLLGHIQQRLGDVRDINLLPDKVLLYVFSFLEPDDIFIAAKVCKRWRYLCAMDDLWILKCLEKGEEEGISNISQLVEQGQVHGVDWMLAYTQLTQALDTLMEQLSPGLDNVDRKKGEMNMARLWMSLIPPTAGDSLEESTDNLDGQKTTLKRSHRKELNTGLQERLREAGLPKGDNTNPDSHTSDTDSVMSEDLSPLLQEYNMLLVHDPPVPQPSKGASPRISKTMRKGGLGDMLEEESTLGASSLPKNLSSRGSRLSKSSIVSNEKETPKDIRTDLSCSKDLLGKLASTTSLEWEQPDTYTDYMRTTLYAGEVVAVKQMRKLQGHKGSILCVYFDRRRLVTCGLDRVIRLWDVRSGRSLHSFLGHKGGIRCVQFDNEILATGSWDCTILIWDMKEFSIKATLQGHQDSVTCLEFNGDFLVSGSEDRSIRLWRRPTFFCQMVIRFEGPVTSLLLVGHLLVVATSDLSLQMIDVYTGSRKNKFEHPLSPLICLVSHGQLLLGGDTEGRVCFWNLTTTEMEAAVRVHDGPVNNLVYLNGRFFTGSGDGTIKEWDLVTMTCLRVLKGHKGAVRDVRVSERRIISCGDDSSTRIWDLVMPTATSPTTKTAKA